MNNRKEADQKKGECRIDLIFSEVYETETRNMEDGSELLQETLEEDEKARILGSILKKIDISLPEAKTERPVLGANGRQARGKKRRILIAALVAVCTFATTAFAAEIFQWDVRLSNHLGIEEQNGALLSGGGMNIGVSAEDGGVAIEAVQAVGDGNNMYILLDVTAPEGETIYPNSGFDMIYLKVDGTTGMGYYCDMLEDDDESDNKASFLFVMHGDNKINNRMINMRFEDLRHYVIGSGETADTGGDWEIDTEGEWELEWKLDYKDISTAYKVKKELEVNGETVDVNSISVSPIALNVQISGAYIEEYDSAPPDPGEEELIQITAVTLKDGTMLTQEDASSWGCSVKGDEYGLHMQMKKLLDPAQVKSVTLNDMEIVLK